MSVFESSVTLVVPTCSRTTLLIRYTLQGTGVVRNFDWEGPKMETLVTLIWLRYSVT